MGFIYYQFGVRRYLVPTYSRTFSKQKDYVHELKNRQSSSLYLTYLMNTSLLTVRNMSSRCILNGATKYFCRIGIRSRLCVKQFDGVFMSGVSRSYSCIGIFICMNSAMYFRSGRVMCSLMYRYLSSLSWAFSWSSRSTPCFVRLFSNTSRLCTFRSSTVIGRTSTKSTRRLPSSKSIVVFD